VVDKSFARKTEPRLRHPRLTDMYTSPFPSSSPPSFLTYHRALLEQEIISLSDAGHYLTDGKEKSTIEGNINLLLCVQVNYI
jgi:hypothetical protein